MFAVLSRLFKRRARDSRVTFVPTRTANGGIIYRPTIGRRKDVMIQDVYSVFDKKTAAYGNLILASHIGEVTRSIERALGDPESALSRWPSEFQVVTLGKYDKSTGKLIPGNVEVVLEVAALVRSPEVK